MTLSKKLICIAQIGSVHEQHQMGVRLTGYTQHSSLCAAALNQTKALCFRDSLHCVLIQACPELRLGT